MIAGRRMGGGVGGRAGVAVVVAACLLVPVFGVSAGGAQTPAGGGVTVQDISLRDQLIANQENLLNTYRCLFRVDVHAVPGGCEDPVTVVAGVVPQNPAQGDLNVRDGLIQSQEFLLNVYRCQYNVDTQLVPGGCSDADPVTTPDADPVATPESDPVATPELDPFTIPEGLRGDDTLITVGHGRTCAVRIDGGAACWGRNELLDRVVLAGIQDVVAITTSNHWGSNLHACLLHEDQTISCWGSGTHGKLGQGDESGRHMPVKVPRINDALAVSAGGEFTCALHRDGGVSCWGRNDWGQMVDGTRLDRLSPRRIPGLSDVVSIASGPNTSCAVHSDGDISCWGRPYDISDSGPERFNTPDAFASVSVGLAVGASSSCATSIGGDVYCWNSRQSPATATRVGGLTDVAKVSVGYASACALHRDGGVSCWGTNQAGEVGDGTTNPRPRPKRVAGISDAVAVNVGFGSAPGDTYLSLTPHACALRADGSALCWGGNRVGQLGDGTDQNRLIPTQVRPIAPIPSDQVPLTPTERLRTWAEVVVQKHEADYPWMRVAWDHIRDQTLATQSGDGGYVVTNCNVSADEFGCSADQMNIERFTLYTLVHELLHVYDLHTGLAPSNSWGAVQLYFATTYAGCYDLGDKSGAEILADTVTHLTIPSALLTYYLRGGCPALFARSSPTAEAEYVVLQGFAGQVPDWYRENITNGAELWAAWRRGPSFAALANLADEFGGLCSTDWITYPLNPELFPPADSNPFKDGGCP